MRREAIYELECLYNCIDSSKDILVVVRDQLSYLKECVESIQRHTKNYVLYIWDNGSSEETRKYLDNLKNVYRSEENLGFIRPNNELAKKGNGDYIILLNSDTKVYEGWDRAMLGYLQANKVAQVGYLGGFLNQKAEGVGFGHGGKVDYICGWCFCVERRVYQEFGLFDENLVFAYCEDADYSLQLRAAGLVIHALHLGLVHHYGNKTIEEVQKERDVEASFIQNHRYLQEKWKKCLPTG